MSQLEAANHGRMMFTCRLSNLLLSQTGTELSCPHNLGDYCKNFKSLIVLKKMKNLISGFQWIKQKRWCRRICDFYGNFSSFLLQIQFCKLMIIPLVTDCPVTLLSCMFLEVFVLLGLEIRKIRYWGKWDLWWAGVLVLSAWMVIIILAHTQAFNYTLYSVARFSFYCIT